MKKHAYRRLAKHRVVTKNPKHAWLEKNYPGYLHSIFMQGIHAGVFLMNKYFPFGFKVGYSFDATTPAGDTEMDWFWDERELVRVRRLFLERGKRSLAFFNRYYGWWQARHREMLIAYRQAEQLDFRQLSDQQLYQAYDRLYWTNITQGAAGYLADCFLTVGETDWLSDFIADRIDQANSTSETIANLTAPTIPTFSNEEEIDLQRMAETIRRTFRTYAAFVRYVAGNRNLSNQLIRHAARFYWVENNYFAKVLSVDYFRRKLFRRLHDPTATDIIAAMRRHQQGKARLLRRFNDRWLTNVIRMSELMTHVQDYRKLGLIRFSHFLHLIFTEMARRTGLTIDDYYNLVEPEVADVFLRRRFDRRQLRARRTRNFTYGTPRGFVVYEGRDIDRYVDDKQFHRSYSGIRLFKGAPAFGGKLTGTARLVRNAHKIGTFNRGDILVTNNTTPEFVPIIKRAGAIITDQGGITCHAAIISRELKIPCVIGTKIATQVLKDGDKVEVDATKGIVKKL